MPVSAPPLLSHHTPSSLRFLMSKQGWGGVGVIIRTLLISQCSRKEVYFVNYCDKERKQLTDPRVEGGHGAEMDSVCNKAGREPGSLQR